MAHIPLIHGPDGSKLRSATARWASMPIGRWAICRRRCATIWCGLGWSHGDQEIFSTEEMIAAFDLPADRPFAGTVRFCQARKSERSLHSRDSRMPIWSAAMEQILTFRRGRQRLASQHDPGFAGEIDRRDAGLEGTRQDFSRTVRELTVHMGRPAAGTGRAGQGLLTPRQIDFWLRIIPRLPAFRLDCARDRNVSARLCRRSRGQARRRGPAAAGRADRQDHLAADFRCARRARQRGASVDCATIG